MPRAREPLKKRSNESAKAYAAFVRYAEMGPRRSLAKAAASMLREAPKAAPSRDQLKRWSRRYGWVKRAAGYDEALAAVRQTETARLARKDARDLAQERAELADDLRQMAVSLKDKIGAIMQHPTALVEKLEHYEDGRPKKIILKPGRWSFGDASRMMETYTALVDVAMCLDEVDPGLTHEQAQHFAARLFEIISENVADPKAKLRVLAGIQRTMEELGWTGSGGNPDGRSTPR